jgi:hypothetical protein
MKNKTIIPVIFRLEKGSKNDVLAVFPTLPEGYGDVSCYAHIGQHSRLSFEYYARTKKATQEQYSDLYQELQSIYNDETTELKIVQRWTQKHNIKRYAEIKRIQGYV